MPEYFDLSFWQVAIATSLILISCAISLALQLGLERRLLLASVRTVVQLLLVGLILQWVFAPGRPWYVVLSIIAMMTLVAGISAVRRTERRYKGVWSDSVISMWASSWLVGVVALMGVIQVQQRGHPWYDPQYSIPLLGMILGNTLNGISLGLDRFGDELAGKRDQVETLLALGATRWEAAREFNSNRGPHRHDSHHQHHDGRGHSQPAGHDDRPDHRRHGAQPGRAVPDRDHVPDRRRHVDGHGERGAFGLFPPVYCPPPIPAGSACEKR